MPRPGRLRYCVALRSPDDMRAGPPQNTNRRGYSLVQPLDYWYIACESGAIGRKPLARTVLGVSLVLFRTRTGQVAAFLDRCPHRNVPLSKGRVLFSGHLQCAYHGWQFDREGECRAVPGLCGELRARGRRAVSFPAVELDGFVWVYMRPDTKPVRRPFRFPLLSDRRYTTVRRKFEVDAPMFHTVENALDVAHTAFLHGGLFRTATKRNEIEAVVRVFGDRVEAEYIGEPRPTGIAARILSPGGGTVQHVDRFFLPCVTQVDYRLGTDSHLLVTAAMVPESDFRTRVYASVSVRTRLPGWVLRPVMEPIGSVIFAQDARVLAAQTKTVRAFGGEQFVSTEIDVMGRHILKLLKAAEQGAQGDVTAEPGTTHRITMLV